MTIPADLIRTHTTAVLRASNAYRNDTAVAAGLCAVCHTRKKEGTKRRCGTCRYDGKKETTQ